MLSPRRKDLYFCRSKVPELNFESIQMRFDVETQKVLKFFLQIRKEVRFLTCIWGNRHKANRKVEHQVCESP